MQLSKNLPKILVAKNISLTKLSKISSVPKSTIHGWTTGQISVNLNQLQSVASALQVSFYELAFGIIDPHQINSSSLEHLFEGDVHLIIKKINSSK